MKDKIKQVASENSNWLRWAQFGLEALVKCWVLALCTLLLVFFMVLVWWLVRNDKDPTGAIIGAAITALLTCVSTLLPGVIKSGANSESE
jgi:uncharacterized BrkB/YihY/UPF0761 family membrane protein